MKRFIFRNSTS